MSASAVGSAATTAPADAQPPVRHPQSPPPGTLLGPHYPYCFGCGDRQPGGLHLSVTVGEGVSVTAEFTVAAAHQGAPGLAHGGVLAAAFDEALGTLLWLIGRPAVTGRLETDYVAPVPVGRTLYIDAECTGVSGRKIYTRASGHLDGPDGPLAVRSAALFVAVPLEHFTTHGGGLHAADMASRYNP